MNQIKEYSNKEIKELVRYHNSLVKDNYQTDEKGMIWMISEANTDPNLSLPYYELSSNETKCGHAVIFEFDWA